MEEMPEPIPPPPHEVELVEEPEDFVGDALSIIRLCANNSLIANILYQKVSGEIQSYNVEPYSLRFKNTRGGVEEFLYAYDIDAMRIKSFKVFSISEAKPTTMKFAPKWEIEI